VSERVPYREQPAVIERWCTCLYVHQQQPDGAVERRIHSADPDCRLHSRDPRHDLPEGL
jgi:hypothetical protein